MSGNPREKPSIPPRVRAAIDAWIAEQDISSWPRLTPTQRAKLRVLFGVDREEPQVTGPGSGDES